MINYIRNQSDGFKGLENSLKILQYLNSYQKIVECNLDVFTKFKGIIENMFLIFRNIHLSERKNRLKIELELAKK